MSRVMLSRIKTSGLFHRIEYQSCLKRRSDVIGTMAPGKPNPAKAQLREKIEAKIGALTAEEKQRQSKIVYDKIISHPWYKTASRVAIFMSTDQEINTAPIIAHIQARGGSAFIPQYAGGVMMMLKLENGDQDIMKPTRHGIQQHSKDQVRENALDGDQHSAYNSHIQARGGSAFIPQYAGGVMRMLKLENGDQDIMKKTRHGIQQHSKDQVRENALDGGLDLIISPGVAFSRDGARLGHGGGYYDKFITNLRSNPTAPKVVAVAFDCQITNEVPMDEHDQKVDDVVFAE